MTLMAALTGMLVAGGLVAIVAGLRRTPDLLTVRTRRGRGLRDRLSRLDRRTKALLLVGLVAGIVVWLMSGWFIAVPLGPLTVAGIPFLLSAPNTGQTARLEALKDWCWALKGSLTTGMSLEDAITASLRSTPPGLRTEVTMLVHRLQARTKTVDALQSFGEDLNDATGDKVVSNLILASKRRGQGLAEVLGLLAESVSREVKVRQQIEAERASVRQEARLVTIVSIGILAVMATRSDYVAPYGTPVGQLILTVLLAAFVGLLVWLRQMASGKPIPRFMAAADDAPEGRL